MSMMKAHEVIMLVKSRFEDLLGAQVQIMSVRPGENAGWVVYVEHSGIIWKQSVSHEGILGSCSREYPQLEFVRH